MKIKILGDLFIRHNEIDKNRESIWFLHGFADSGLAYMEVFDSSLSIEFNLYVVDLPGFGVSPVNIDYLSIKEHANLLSEIIKKETENGGKVSIVAHSIGALIGTWICENQPNKINYYFNIEGNLTEADSYFSSKPLNFKTAEDFIKSFEAEIFEYAIKNEQYRRYYSSLRFAVPEEMRNWGITSQEHVKNNKCGFEFKNLNCNKVYIWGDLDTPKETQEFIKVHDIPNKLYREIGHWHMIENSKTLYTDINNIIKNGLEQFV
ncbi:alpha/beta fold hydrolase [Winogradskyella sp.]|uniref:alpha/beta fold hydrolase n=1 Tax=Winogradskyella sp. TaxID=1883156 RepID=UPI001B259B37|nr:alpha/beta fold hydrolase [Winogradskyella sp.]MBO6879437.1 alpha/beta fold hydrolase [Winogradskyella sp.]